jgi:hypothetical protein
MNAWAGPLGELRLATLGRVALTTLTTEGIKKAARDFAVKLSALPIPLLYGVTDGKAVGTFVEQDFHRYLGDLHDYEVGNAASGIDFPSLSLDLKVTSIKQPQSSCPFRDASQKVYGLGYDLLVMVYEKIDDKDAVAARLLFKHLLFIPRERTADYQTTFGLRGILSRSGNVDDVVAFLEERNLPLDEIGRQQLAERILVEPPELGCLTISNALQWRLQYGRAIAWSTQGASGIEPLL